MRRRNLHPHRPVEDTIVPGGVYLCQVSDTVSCGACCGLYNVHDTSRQSMKQMLKNRSVKFAEVSRTADAIEAFARELEAVECQQRPFPEFHHCPFIGLIGPDLGRVGCLLHPLAAGNNGVDFRGLSYYGGLACRTYFCPATHRPEARYKRIVRGVLDDWHLYGTVATEIDLVNALFKHIEDRIGRKLDDDAVIRNPAVRATVSDMLGLKLEWPFRPAQADTPCHYFFFDVQYEKPAINYNDTGATVSEYDDILYELVSSFSSTSELRRAERMIQQKIDIVLEAVRSMLAMERH